MDDQRPSMTKEQWDNQMIVLQAGINMMQKRAMETGLSLESVARAAFIAAVTFCRVDGIPDEKFEFWFRDAMRATPTREQMKGFQS